MRGRRRRCLVVHPYAAQQRQWAMRGRRRRCRYTQSLSPTPSSGAPHPSHPTTALCVRATPSHSYPPPQRTLSWRALPSRAHPSAATHAPVCSSCGAVRLWVRHTSYRSPPSYRPLSTPHRRSRAGGRHRLSPRTGAPRRVSPTSSARAPCPTPCCPRANNARLCPTPPPDVPP